jgi:hypothetical protein
MCTGGRCATRFRVALRKVQRHPLMQKTLRTSFRIQKKIIRGATLSVIPSGIDDVVFHHAPLTIDEAVHLMVDQAAIGTLTGVIALLLVLAKE